MTREKAALLVILGLLALGGIVLEIWYKMQLLHAAQAVVGQ